MIEELTKDLALVEESAQRSGFDAAFRIFGSTATGRRRPGSDVDVALIVVPAEKQSVVSLLRTLGVSSERLLNWTIDVFDCMGKTFGYNRRHAGAVHFLILDQFEYDGDSPLARKIRASGGDWIGTRRPR